MGLGLDRGQSQGWGWDQGRGRCLGFEPGFRIGPGTGTSDGVCGLKRADTMSQGVGFGMFDGGCEARVRTRAGVGLESRSQGWR